MADTTPECRFCKEPILVIETHCASCGKPVDISTQLRVATERIRAGAGRDDVLSSLREVIIKGLSHVTLARMHYNRSDAEGRIAALLLVEASGDASDFPTSILEMSYLHSPPELRKEIIRTLSMAGSDDSVRTLTRILDEEEDPAIRSVFEERVTQELEDDDPTVPLSDVVNQLESDGVLPPGVQPPGAEPPAAAATVKRVATGADGPPITGPVQVPPPSLIEDESVDDDDRISTIDDLPDLPFEDPGPMPGTDIPSVPPEQSRGFGEISMAPTPQRRKPVKVVDIPSPPAPAPENLDLDREVDLPGEASAPPANVEAPLAEPGTPVAGADAPLPPETEETTEEIDLGDVQAPQPPAAPPPAPQPDPLSEERTEEIDLGDVQPPQPPVAPPPAPESEPVPVEEAPEEARGPSGCAIFAVTTLGSVLGSIVGSAAVVGALVALGIVTPSGIIEGVSGARTGPGSASGTQDEAAGEGAGGAQVDEGDDVEGGDIEEPDEEATVGDEDAAKTDEEVEQDGAGEPVLLACSVDASTQHPRYPAKNVTDGDPKTVWQEDRKLRPVGQSLVFTFEEPVIPVEIGIIVGYDDEDRTKGDLWPINDRLKKARLTFDGAASVEIELEDVREMQWVPIEVTGPVSEIELEVVEVYRSSWFHDNCIAEVQFRGTQP